MKKNAEEIKLVKDWLGFARENLLFARAGMKEDYAPYHTMCFLCQGSAEKYLKAFLIWNGWELKKIHDLEDLLGFCMDFEPEFEDLKEECSLLNEYITEARYPGDLPFESIGEPDAREAIESAEKVEELVLKKINLPVEEEINNHLENQDE
ncbi:HEPN domain-containing protein [bacterium]|nr:HEPN domain-containing protein [bacterium]